MIRTFIEYLNIHPTYIVPLIKSHNFVLYDVGPLAPVVRHYIGILVSFGFGFFFFVVRSHFIVHRV